MPGWCSLFTWTSQLPARLASGAEPLEGPRGEERAGWLPLLLLPDLIQPPRLSCFQSDSDRLTLILGLCIYCFQKSLQMVTAAVKLKDACSLEGKLSPT